MTPRQAKTQSQKWIFVTWMLIKRISLILTFDPVDAVIQGSATLVVGDGDKMKVIDKLVESHSVLASFRRVEGWCSPAKARALMAAVLDTSARACVEIGVFGGSSLVPVALALRELGHRGKVYGIDPWDTAAALDGMVAAANREWWSGVQMGKIKASCEAIICDFGLSQYVELIQARSEDVVGRFESESLDLLHVDGNHSERHSLGDVEAYLPKLRSGGIVFVDDIWWAEGGKYTTQAATLHILDYCEEITIVSDCLQARKR